MRFKNRFKFGSIPLYGQSFYSTRSATGSTIKTRNNPCGKQSVLWLAHQSSFAFTWCQSNPYMPKTHLAFAIHEKKFSVFPPVCLPDGQVTFTILLMLHFTISEISWLNCLRMTEKKCNVVNLHHTLCFRMWKGALFAIYNHKPLQISKKVHGHVSWTCHP